MMTLNFKDIGLNKEVIGFLLIILLLFAFSLYRSVDMDNNGIYTVCKVSHYEPAASGSSLYIDIYYQGKIRKYVANNLCRQCDGKFFFVRLIKDKPNGHVLFLKEYPIPDCLNIDSIPKEGWNEIPKCE